MSIPTQSIEYSKREEYMDPDDFNTNRHGGQSIGMSPELDLENIHIRRADGDDSRFLEELIDVHIQDVLDILYNYPKLLRLIETSFLSIAITDAESRILGLAVFDDKPQGLEGMIDYRHENYWEYWIDKAYNLNDIEVRSCNTLWLTYFFLDKSQYSIDPKLEVEILKKVFQNVYGTFSNVEGILFLLRGETQDDLKEYPSYIEPLLNQLCYELDAMNKDVLKKVRGINPESRLFISPRSKCLDPVEIRIARQEDHDDLAYIFNQQSEVLTQKFGEFFLAELIAFQNENQKAFVAQVKDKAFGLMSVSKEIDYKLLAECFELEIFDNLFKPEFMEAVNNKRQELEDNLKYEKIDREREILKKIREEKLLCSSLGQRLSLQQFVQDKDQEIKTDLEKFQDDEVAKTLNRKMVEEMLDKWLNGFKLCQPSDLFLKYNTTDPDIHCWIITEREFFLETLTFFGLPKNYMDGEGHWKDWAKKILEDKKNTANLRRGLNSKVKAKKETKPGRKGAKQEEKKEDELKPPSYFDLQPFIQAFNKFIACGAEVRTHLRFVISSQMKNFILLFSDANGLLKNDRCFDLITAVAQFQAKGIVGLNNLTELLPIILECFGEITFETLITKKDPNAKEETKENLQNKKITKMLKSDSKDPKDIRESREVIKEIKEPRESISPLPGSNSQPGPQAGMQEPPKLIDVIQKLTSYAEFMDALERIRDIDSTLSRLRVIKSPSLQKEVEELIANEELELETELKKREKVKLENPYNDVVEELNDPNGLPPIPPEAHNAICINLFCIDENYESRSIDFLEYAFKLFPDRDYIILTQPHTVPENVLLQSFIQVTKKKDCLFDHVLYVFHKDALLASLITVIRSKIDDVYNGSYLYSSLKNRNEIEKELMEAIENTSSNNIAFTVSCADTIIGQYLITKDVNLPYYRSHFCIQDFILLDQHSRNGYSRILHGILNPIFQKSARFILKELMRLANKTCFFFEIHEKTALPDLFNELLLVRSRKFPHLLEKKWDYERDPEYMDKIREAKYVQDSERDPLDEKEAIFALTMVTKKLLSINKISNNTRIIVVGASDTGISFIESLLSVRYVNFPHIILLAPGGLHTIHVKSEYLQLKAYSTNYTLNELRNLMLEARITVIDARMVNIDRKGKMIHLDKNAQLAYDLLVLTLGLIDIELQNVGLVSDGSGRVNEKYGIYQDKKYVAGVFSIDDPYLYSSFATNTNNLLSPISQLTRKKKPQNITIYGRSLHAYCFLNGLLNRGVKPPRINLVLPPRKYEKKRTFQTNQEKWDYEDMCVWDPDAFEDERIENKIKNILRTLGVNLYENYELKEFLTTPNNELQKLIFTSQDEEEEPLELSSKFLLTSRCNDIDINFFHAIHENGLVYNGRLIVMNNFQTTDPAIFAAGRLCEFSQRYKNEAIGTSLRLDKYSGREIGQKLSRSILEHLGLIGNEADSLGENELPVFFMSLGIGGVIPNDLYYYSVRKIDWAKPENALKLPPNREDLVCDNIKNLLKGHFLKFVFDNVGLIDSVTYMGTEKISVQSVVSFVGLAETYLNKVDVRFKSHLIENATEFLSENWAIALYHEWFSIFRYRMKNEVAYRGNIQEIFEKVAQKARKGKFYSKKGIEKIRKMVSEEAIKAIEDGTLDFIRENINHLPMYYIPGEEFP